MPFKNKHQKFDCDLIPKDFCITTDEAIKLTDKILNRYLRNLMTFHLTNLQHYANSCDTQIDIVQTQCISFSSSVTRFGNFCLFCKILKVLSNVLRVYLVLAILLNKLGQIYIQLAKFSYM